MNQYLLLIKYKKLNNKNMLLQKTLPSLIYADNIRENPVELGITVNKMKPSSVQKIILTNWLKLNIVKDFDKK